MSRRRLTTSGGNTAPKGRLCQGLYTCPVSPGCTAEAAWLVINPVAVKKLFSSRFDDKIHL